MKLQFSRTQASPVEPHHAKESKTSGALPPNILKRCLNKFTGLAVRCPYFSYLSKTGIRLLGKFSGWTRGLETSINPTPHFNQLSI